MEWLLLDTADCDELLADDTTSTLDSSGQSWWFYDHDGTILGLRRRGLPEYIDLPEPERLIGDSYAIEGYPGRKRAEIQMCRETLQDAGSGLWLGMWCYPGDGLKERAVPEAAQTVANIMDRRAAPTHRGVLRFDGAYGSWSTIDACQTAKVGYLLRWSRYGLLNTKEVVALRAQACWVRVRDSLSGPVRYATDLGYHDSPDGRYRARVVCSRYRDETGTGVGYSLDGWRYELFFTTLPADQWSADQVVTAYYGRIGQENRFGQEDQEIRLDSIFSVNLPGQALASLIGLFVWNLQTVAGYRLSCEEIPEDLPPQSPRILEVQPEEANPQPKNPLVKLLETSVDWENSLPSGWQWEPVHGLQCPAGTQLHVKRVRDGAIVFRTRYGACLDCPIRSQCTKSTQPRFRKEIQVRALIDIQEEIRAMKRRGLKSATPRPAGRQQSKVSADRWTPPSDVEVGTMEVAGPFLVPSELRHDFHRAAARVEAMVEVHVPLREPVLRLVAFTSAKRQRRRLTWAERDTWNELPAGVTVCCVVNGWRKDDADRLLASTGWRTPQPVDIAV